MTALSLRSLLLIRLGVATVLGLSLASLGGCGSGSSSGEWYSNWDIAGGCSSDQGGDMRASGAGTQVDVCAAVGEHDWVWVTYAAPWCSASRSQASQVRAFKNNADPNLAVYTVLTAGDEPFTPATISHARSLAASYGLAPDHMLAEESSRTIPQHLLIGPDGRTYYRYVGFLAADEMRQILDDFRESRRMPDVRSLPHPGR